MADGAFRRIDIDLYDEDKLLEEELYEPYALQPPQASQRAKEVEREVRGLLSKGDSAGALALVLADPPYGSQHTDARTTSTNTLLSILLSTKATDSPALIKSLSPLEQDNLMKYIYKAMQNPDEGPQGTSTCGVLLSWHERLIEVAGLGCVVRVLTDHRRV